MDVARPCTTAPSEKNRVDQDVFVVTIDAQGAALGPAVAVAEVNSSDSDNRPTVRFDGREMLLSSNRDGRGGNFDLFVSTRRSRNGCKYSRLRGSRSRVHGSVQTPQTPSGAQ